VSKYGLFFLSFDKTYQQTSSMATEPVGAMPPPPGVVANFVNPPNQLAGNLALHIVCLSLVTMCMAMRVYTRTRINRFIWWDDRK
jgi:hypothetical protein